MERRPVNDGERKKRGEKREEEKTTTRKKDATNKKTEKNKTGAQATNAGTARRLQSMKKSHKKKRKAHKEEEAALYIERPAKGCERIVHSSGETKQKTERQEETNERADVPAAALQRAFVGGKKPRDL
uniref:Uncharacterized protein n=1 Tax=Toxoplasma gondii COUG TaxID=1074873 RepID=A0A2G8YFB0_TOXGO|nr:hypothetical protein TGCOUG_263637 [Toxoplasma gondii COUG]